MKFFIDTAKVDDIRKANDMGIICGVTTNPSLIAKEGRDYKTVLKEIAEIVDGAISGEVKATTEDAEGMIKEGREIAAQGRSAQDRFFGGVFAGLSQEDLLLWQSMVDRVCDNISSLEG